jgi:AraC-like DNA-binding protein
MRLLNNISSQLYEGFLPAPFELLGLIKYPLSQDNIYHKHEGFQIIVPTSGKFMVQDRAGKEYIGVPGTAIVIPPGVNHIWRVEDQAETIQFCHEPFSLEEFGELHAIFGGGSNKAIMLLSIDQKKTTAFVAELKQEMATHSAGRGVMIYARLLDLLVCALRCSDQVCRNLPDRHEQIISRTLNYIEKNYRKPISLKDMARYSHLGVSRFSQIFRTQTGRSPINYLNHMRIEKARSLLVFSIMSISEITEYLGFSSIHYFSRMFKKHTGISPAKYRNDSLK